jgi:hypothetical protein
MGLPAGMTEGFAFCAIPSDAKRRKNSAKRTGYVQHS